MLYSYIENKTGIAFIYRKNAITYEELRNLTQKFAYYLYLNGIGRDDRIAVVSRNSPYFVAISFAAFKLGAVVVPVNFMSKKNEIKYFIDKTDAKICFYQKEFEKNIPDVKKVEIESILNDLKATDTPTLYDENLTAFIIFTSGTVGEPKGVVLSHKNFHTNVLQCIDALNVDRSFNFMCLLPMFHTFAWTTCVLIPLYIGTKTLIVESVFDFKKHLKDIYSHRITAILGVPPIFHALSKVKGVKKWILKFLLSRVKFCVSGAAKLPLSVLEEFEKKFKIPLLEGYGLSEASPVVSVNRLDSRKHGSVGKPLKGIEVKILDENENPATEGEICIKGENVFKGYHLNEEETKKAFTKDGFLKTGDIGKIVDGFLYILDRKKDIIIVKGMNVYPNEIEENVLDIPGVVEAAAVGIPDESGDEKIVLYIKESKPVDTELIKSKLKKALAPYKLPKEIIKIDEMPKNAMQKILKRELRRLYLKK